MPRFSLTSGFTIPELLITMTVASILLGLLFGPLNDLYVDNNAQLRNIVQLTDNRAALRQIENNITLSNKFLDTSISDIGVSPTKTWNWKGDGIRNDASSRNLITENFGTDPAIDDGTGARNIVLTYPACDITAAQVFNYVYFVKNSTLYRKTLLKSSYPTGCNGNSVQQKQSCVTLTATARCKALDAIIVRNVKYFSVDYYGDATSSDPLDSDNGTPPHTKYSTASSSIPGTAKSIIITLTISSTSGGKTVDTTSHMRMTRINGAS